ncbi:MAG: ankyrin repeat domain-containing protein [Burkholderiales bacterium]
MNWLVRALTSFYWLAIAAGSVWACFELNQWQNDYLKPLWTSSRLVEVQARIESVSKGSDSVQLRYRYQFGEHTYYSQRLTFDPQRGKIEGVSIDDLYNTYEFRERHRLTVTAWVDPKNPGFAVLDKSVQWLPVSALAALFAILGLVFVAALRQALSSAGLLKWAEKISRSEPSSKAFPWGPYRALALLLITANIAAWTFLPGSLFTLFGAIAGAIVLAFPLVHFRQRWLRWLYGSTQTDHIATDSDWLLRPTRNALGIRLIDSANLALTWGLGCLAIMLSAWVFYVLVFSPYAADLFTLILGAAAALGTGTLSLAISNSGLKIHFNQGGLLVERSRLFKLQMLGKIRIEDIRSFERLPDPAGNAGHNPWCRWRVMVRQKSKDSAAPLTPFLPETTAQTVETALSIALDRAQKNPGINSLERSALSQVAAIRMVVILALIMIVLITHWQWKRYDEGVKRIMPDGSLSIKKPIRDPLIRAIYRTDLAAVESALKAGANPNQIDDEGLRPLHRAIIVRSPEVAALLLRSGANTDSPEIDLKSAHAKSVLMWAADQPEMFELLLTAGADIHLRDKTGASAMHYSAGKNNLKAMLLLQARGLSIDDRTGSDGATPLMWAFWWWAPDSIDWLIKQGARQDVRDFRGLNLEHYARTSTEPELALKRLAALRVSP